MKKINVFLITVLLFAFAPKAHSQSPYVSVFFQMPTNSHNLVTQDVIMNIATSQNGVPGTTDISYPYYGVSQQANGALPLGLLYPPSEPTGISNAFIVNILPTDSYITVYNPNGSAVTGTLLINFDGGYSVGSSVTLNGKTTTTIPVTAAMTHIKTYPRVANNTIYKLFTN